jgi:hypothetical protein
MADSVPEDPHGSLMGELLGVVPRFLDRTQRQVAFSARTLAHLPCLGRLLRPPSQGPDVPAHEAPQAADVLSVLTTAEEPAATPAAAPSVAAVEDVASGPVPEVDSLPIPGYESLAASQVIPRLTALTPDELRAVGAYERATRRRQTILHRVSQLLAA